MALTGPSSSCSIARLCSFCLQSVQNLKADLADGLFLAGKLVGIFKGKYYLFIGVTANQKNWLQISSSKTLILQSWPEFNMQLLQFENSIN